jgi:pyruvate,water dikinase
MLRRPRLAAATIAASRWPGPADRLFFRAHVTHWERDVLVPYQRAVADAERRAPTAAARELCELIDQLADLAGDFLWSFVLCGGAAWRFEIALARFCQRQLRDKGMPSYQVLLSGLGFPGIPRHAVHSLDWFRETIGERPDPGSEPEAAALRHKAASDERLAATEAALRTLAADPRRQERFALLLNLAERYAVIRAEHAQWFTLAWPVLRQCVRRLGAMMAAAGLLDQADDVFFASRAEVGEYMAGGRPRLSAQVAGRRAAWERDRRLVPPLELGKRPFLLAKVLLSSPKVARAAATATEGALRGTPASPGSAAGPVRVVRDPADAEAVRPGDVLVVPAATPALTRVFDRIAALCVDSGSVAAHASLVAREFGIPTVTGLGDATARLTDGMWVFVDGTAGVVDVR